MKKTWNEMKEWCKALFVFDKGVSKPDAEPVLEGEKEDREVQGKLEKYLCKQYDFRYNLLTE